MVQQEHDIPIDTADYGNTDGVSYSCPDFLVRVQSDTLPKAVEFKEKQCAQREN